MSVRVHLKGGDFGVALRPYGRGKVWELSFTFLPYFVTKIRLKLYEKQIISLKRKKPKKQWRQEQIQTEDAAFLSLTQKMGHDEIQSWESRAVWQHIEL